MFDLVLAAVFQREKSMNSIHQSNMQSKTAIITGSGRGIGRETAILLAEHVANVVVCYIS